MELAQLDVTDTQSLGQSIVSAVARHLGTDRVSLVTFRLGEQAPAHMSCTGFEVPRAEWGHSAKVISNVRESMQELLVYDVREQPKLLAPWADTYRTDVFAVFPLVYRHQVLAVLCVSNLSRQQLIQLQNMRAELDLVIAQLQQLAKLLLEKPADEAPSAAEVAADELALIGNLLEKLDQTLDTRNVFTVFGELIASQVPLKFMAVMHDSLTETQRGVVCAYQPTHIAEVRKLFDELSHQWQRRHRRAPRLELKQATMHGGDILKREGKCPAALRLGRCETFPVFLDNDLFALVVIAADDEILANNRRMRLFNVLAHHLMLHVKKGLLLAQNQEMQTVDALTGLYNERHFYLMMEREFDRASRYGVPLALLIIDVDHFKDVNETYGFETGDMLLCEISRILMENMRSTDFVSRYSGERFIVVLPETHYKNAEVMANRLRRFIENNSFYIPNTNVFIKVTVSIGVASHLDHRPTSLAQFIEFADTALYFAKRGGRNQVVGYSYVINMMLRETEHES